MPCELADRITATVLYAHGSCVVITLFKYGVLEKLFSIVDFRFQILINFFAKLV